MRSGPLKGSKYDGAGPARRQTPDLDAYLERSRIRPGQVTAGSQIGAEGHGSTPETVRPHSTAYVPGLAEVDRLDQLAWTDTTIAQALPIHLSNVSRRRVNGFSVDPRPIST